LSQPKAETALAVESEADAGRSSAGASVGAVAGPGPWVATVVIAAAPFSVADAAFKGATGPEDTEPEGATGPEDTETEGTT
jgi:hypothetical protein